MEDPDDSFKWAPVIDNNYWTIQLKSVQKIYRNNQTINNDSVDGTNIIECQNDQCKTILDTGTYLIYGP